MKSFVCSILLVFAIAQAEISWASYKSRDIPDPTRVFRLPSSRIVNGQEAQPYQFPWQVALNTKTSQGSIFCGGSLISRNWVMTTASCVNGGTEIQVILGAHKFASSEPGQIRMNSTHFIQHENWNSQNRYVDNIALVKLPETVPLSNQIKLVQLPSRSDISNSFEGSIGTVSGWGYDSEHASGISTFLRFFQNPIISNAKCAKAPSSIVCVSGSQGKSLCIGDSGDPLIIGVKKQVGISIFTDVNGCGAGNPSGYTRVTSYLDWIEAKSDVVIE